MELPTGKLSAVGAGASGIEKSSNVGQDDWSDVISKKGKRRLGGKGGGRGGGGGGGYGGGGGVEESSESSVSPQKGYVNQNVNARVEVADKKDAVAEGGKATTTLNQVDDWNEVVSSHRKRNSGEKLSPDKEVGGAAQPESKPLPPWRTQPRQPRQTPLPVPAPRQEVVEDRWAALRPERFDTPKSPDSSAAVAPREKSDRFAALEPDQASGRNSGGGGVRAGRRSEPRNDQEKEEQEKEDAKQQKRDEIQHEIHLIVMDSQSLEKKDFNMKASQRLHAIHLKGGIEKIREALQQVRLATQGKARESVTNWPGYVFSLLKKFHEALIENEPKEPGDTSPKRGTPPKEPFDKSSPKNTSPKASPALGPKASAPNSLSSQFSLSLRPGTSPKSDSPQASAQSAPKASSLLTSNFTTSLRPGGQ